MNGRDLYGSGRPYHFAENSKCHYRDQAHFTWGWLRETGCGQISSSQRTSGTRSGSSSPAPRSQRPGNRGPRHQSAEIEADDLIKVVVLALRSLSRDQKLWPFSPQSLHTLLSRIGATPFRKGPGLLTWVHFGRGERLTCCSRRKDSELVRRRGRWASAKLMEIYLQGIFAALFLPTPPRGQKDKVASIAAGFADLLQQAIEWKQEGIEGKIWYSSWRGTTTYVG